jgi:hypothetical protein
LPVYILFSARNTASGRGVYSSGEKEMRKSWILAAVVVVAIATIFVVDFMKQARTRKKTVSIPQPSNSSQLLDVAGVSDPMLVSAEESRLRDDDIVIGVAAYGESRAYLRRAFDRDPQRHVVNDSFASIPVSITHCDKTRCTRVLTRGKANEPIEIHCGGWLDIQEMALVIGEKMYPQSSSQIPLTDVPFVVSTWKEWREKHPNSLVYVGDATELEKTLQNIPVTEVN